MAEFTYWLALAMICAGGLALIIGAIGLVRLPDVYSRIHAAGIIDTAGAALMIFGMCLLSPSWLITLKLVMIGIFLFFTSPISGHAIAQVAQSQGIKPLARDKSASAEASTGSNKDEEA